MPEIYPQVEGEDQDIEDDEASYNDYIAPSHSDPKLFRVKCRRGEEREAAIRVFRKYFDMREHGE